MKGIYQYINIGDYNLQKAFEICLTVYENTNDGDHFWVSDFYRLATNIVPDLTFGLLGMGFLVNDNYIAMFQKQSDIIRNRQQEDGNLWYGFRAMYQILYPIWVHRIYMYTGDKKYLVSHHLALIKAFEYLFRHEDTYGFVKLVGHGEWKYSEGADWVDWCAERMEGKTMVFQTWYYQSLQCTACIMNVLGEFDIAKLYVSKALHLKENINSVFWRKNHYLDNIDFDGKEVDHYWLDTQLWPIVFGIADDSQSMYILNHIECMGSYDEGVPTRWRESTDVSEVLIGNSWRDNGNCTWFGRLGAGDILARYRMGHNKYAQKLLNRISELFIRDGTVYECYDMDGNAMPKNIGGGNYLEHAGGYILAVMEGLFGIGFPYIPGIPLVIHPRFSSENNVWPGVSGELEAGTCFKYLGKIVSYVYKCKKLGDRQFRKTLQLGRDDGMREDKTISALVYLDFVHPLPVFTMIEEVLVDGKVLNTDIDPRGRIIFDVQIPCFISVTYSERMNHELDGLPEEQALTDCK